MENELYQIILTGGAMGLFYILYLIVKIIFVKRKNGDTNYSKEMAQGIATISENHLHSIEECIKEQTRQSHDDHQKQYEILCQISANTKK